MGQRSGVVDVASDPGEQLRLVDQHLNGRLALVRAGDLAGQNLAGETLKAPILSGRGADEPVALVSVARIEVSVPSAVRTVVAARVRRRAMAAPPSDLLVEDRLQLVRELLTRRDAQRRPYLGEQFLPQPIAVGGSGHLPQRRHKLLVALVHRGPD